MKGLMAARRGLAIGFRILGAGLAGLGALMLAVTLTPLVYWWGGKLAGPWNDPKGDTLIVLGGSVLDNGMIGANSYWRSVYAVLAYREGGFREVVVSGGGKSGLPIAEPMRDFLRCEGVPEAAIRLELRSRNTRENALFVKELLAEAPGRKVLLTSDYHMYRAHRAFRKAGIEVLPRPFPDVRKRAVHWLARWPAFLDLVGESVAIGYYWIRGWM